MREIKFRAWDKERKEIIPDLEDHYIIEIEGYSTLIFGEPLTSKLKINEYIKPERIILMQFTGLKDKNGKEIYEGDIIQIPDYYYGDFFEKSHKNIVVFIDGGFDCYIKKEDMFDDLADIAMNELIEVIGNIYENPELIK